QSVQVNVHEAARAKLISLEQGVGGTAHQAGDAQSPRQTAHAGGLARAQITAQVQDAAGSGGTVRLRQRATERFGGAELVKDRGQLHEKALYGGMPASSSPLDTASLLADLKRWAEELGFAALGIASIELAEDEAHFLEWLNAGFAGEMHYMGR